jgi:hypothetical protein
MKALCMIRVLPGQVDKVLNLLKRKRSISKDVMVVSGSADICVILNASITDINKISTETLIEVEVDLGW